MRLSADVLLRDKTLIDKTKKMKLYILPLLFVACMPSSAQETPMKDIFATAPASIFPLLTKNNKLDCIDFIENGMTAKVKNKMEEWSELKSLTPRYLQMQVSERSDVVMMLVGDSVICTVNTYCGPAKDSEVRFYDLHWRPLVRKGSVRPQVSDFIRGEMDAESKGLLEAMPFMSASLNPEDNTLTWQLQTTELPTDKKKAADECLQPIVLKLE